MGKKDNIIDKYKWDYTLQLLGAPVGRYMNMRDKQSLVSQMCINSFIRTNAMFKYENLPKNINAQLLELNLQYFGFTVITHVSDEEIRTNKDRYQQGLYMFSQGVGLGGQPDNNYLPTIAIINNPSMGLSIQRTINQDCVLIRNDIFLNGLSFINNEYASLLTDNIISMRMYSINSRAIAVFRARDNNSSDSAMTFLSALEDGSLGVTITNDMFNDDGLTTLPWSNSTDKMKGLIEYHQYLKGSWFNELGINANFNMKREALNSNETEVGEAALLPLVDNMLEIRQEDIALLNEMYQLNVSVALNSSWQAIHEEVHEETSEGTEVETLTMFNQRRR